jgi:dTDP-4-amino-4,6-dideoxygalactose transaminase
MRRLAVIGGEPAFADGLPFARPARPPLERVMARLAGSYDQGILTNGPLVRQLEEEAAARLGVDHAVAVASCTAGLMLTVQALIEPGQTVLMPSFTFSATSHAAVWAGGTPIFAECGPADCLLDPADAARRLNGCAALVGTHVFGAPCHPERLDALGRAMGVPVVFDAAHAFGATRSGWPVGGFGTAEVFSLSPTKVLVAGEGGIVTTHDAALAARLRIGRDYGNPGDYDTRFAGLNARLSELHAALALESLRELDEHLARRRELVALYRERLDGVPGLTPQRVDPADRSTYKDFTVIVDERRFGPVRDDLVAALRAEGIDTRCYFSPPVHRQQAYRNGSGPELPVTDWLAARVISLPLWRDLAPSAVERVADVVGQIHDHADQLSGVARQACAPS